MTNTLCCLLAAGVPLQQCQAACSTMVSVAAQRKARHAGSPAICCPVSCEHAGITDRLLRPQHNAVIFLTCREQRQRQQQQLLLHHINKHSRAAGYSTCLLATCRAVGPPAANHCAGIKGCRWMAVGHDSAMGPPSIASTNLDGRTQSPYPRTSQERRRVGPVFPGLLHDRSC